MLVSTERIWHLRAQPCALQLAENRKRGHPEVTWWGGGGGGVRIAPGAACCNLENARRSLITDHTL